MTTIGTFKLEEHGYSGTLETLTLDILLRFVPTETKSDRSPAYRITRDEIEVGAAWHKTSKKDGRTYLRVSLDDPTFVQPIYAALFPVDGEENLFRLVWERTKDTN